MDVKRIKILRRIEIDFPIHDPAYITEIIDFLEKFRERTPGAIEDKYFFRVDERYGDYEIYLCCFEIETEDEYVQRTDSMKIEEALMHRHIIEGYDRLQAKIRLDNV